MAGMGWKWVKLQNIVGDVWQWLAIEQPGIIFLFYSFIYRVATICDLLKTLKSIFWQAFDKDKKFQQNLDQGLDKWELSF